MDVSFVLGCLPLLVAIDNVFVDDADLFIDPEVWGAVFVLYFSCDGFYLLMELVYLL